MLTGDNPDAGNISYSRFVIFPCNVKAVFIFISQGSVLDFYRKPDEIQECNCHNHSNKGSHSAYLKQFACRGRGKANLEIRKSGMRKDEGEGEGRIWKSGNQECGVAEGGRRMDEGEGAEG